MLQCMMFMLFIIVCEVSYTMILTLIKKYSPEIADSFLINNIPPVDKHNAYEIEAVNGKIQLSGDNNISLAMAYYRYMKDYCNVCMTHCGDFSFDVKSAPLPTEKISEVILQDNRIALTPSAQSNTACFWDWDRWEKEIDFMAMRGINMPYICVGLQAVAYYTLLELNVNEDLALSTVSGPAFFDRQLTGCISGYFNSPAIEYIEHTKILGKKIFDRELAFGMTPILQGYWGHVPYIFGASSGNKLLHSKEWYGFTRTNFLKPWENMFTQFGRTFLEKQKKLIGESKYFSLPLFTENELPLSSSKYINNLTERISHLHSEIADEYKFIIPSSVNDKVLSGLDPEKVILLKGDINNKNTNYSFILENKAHLADRTVLEGSLEKLADFDYSQALSENPNLYGMALTSEGYNQNPMYYDLAFDSLTTPGKTDLSAFLKSYSERRWGKSEASGKVAEILKDTCYGNYDLPHLGSAVCARPAVLLNHTAPYDVIKLPYDNAELFKALNLLIENRTDSDAYIYDVCDILRQVISNHCLKTFDLAIHEYKKQHADKYEFYSNKFLELLGDLNRLLLTRHEFSLKARVDSARSLAKSDEAKTFYEVNALAQVSIYGHIDKAQLYDYAWKEWGGMIDTFYKVRWRKFFELLAENFFRFKKVAEKTKKQKNGRNTFDDDYFYSNMAKYERTWITLEEAAAESDEDTMTVVIELVDKYRDDFSGKN